MRKVRKCLIFLLATLSAIACASLPHAGGSVEQAFQQHSSNIQVTGEGVVTRILRDDNDGTPHQRFILRLASGQTVLISHNIALAPRIDDIESGDTVGFSGEYIWNEQGGLIHRTHRDPAGRHPGGWLKRGGRTYE